MSHKAFFPNGIAMNVWISLCSFALLFAAHLPSAASEPVEIPIGDDKVFSQTFSADGKLLAIGTGGSQPTVKVIDIASKKEVAAFPCEGRGAGFTVAFSPDGKLLAIGDYDQSIKVRNLKDGTEFASLPGDPDRKKYRQARRLVFTPDGTQLVAGYSTGEIFVWNLALKKIDVQFNHGNEITALATSPDGKSIASGTDFGLRIWNRGDGSVLVKLDKKSSGEHQVQALAFFPDGNSIVTADSPGYIRVFSTVEGQELGAFKVDAVGNGTTVYGIGLARDGKTIVIPGLVAGLDPQRPRNLTEGIVLIDAKSLRPRAFLPAGSGRIFAQSPDGKSVALCSGDRGDSVNIYDLKSATNLKPASN